MTDIKNLRNRAKRIKLLATDLDGTLLDQSHALTDGTRLALIRLAEKGVILAAATGRSRSSLPDTVTSLKGLKYLITANGAKLFLNETNEIIYEKYLSVEALDSVSHFFDDPDVMCEVFWGGVPHVEQSRYDDAKNYGIPKWFSDYFFKSREPVEEFYTAVREHEREIENINFVFGNDQVQARVLAALSERTGLYELTSSFPFNYEVGGIGVSKGAAVDFIAGREGILPEETICFGDNDNDVTMIEYAGIGIATANAVPRALAAADFVTEDNENEGVVKALEILGLL
jgi:Cof subfamily protein (haloacid dehalogenase superfamily)